MKFQFTFSPKKYLAKVLTVVLIAVAPLSHAVTYKRESFLVDTPSRGVWSTTPYVYEGRILVHFQPASGSTDLDFVLDLARGQPWQGSLGNLLSSDARPLDLSEGLVPKNQVSRSDVHFHDKKLVDFLGCSYLKHIACTALTDEGVLVFRGVVDNGTKTRFDVVDMSGFLTYIDDVLAGRVLASKADLGLAEFQLIDILAERRDIVDRWVSALRSIQTIDQLRKAYANAKSLQLFSRPYFAPEAISGEAMRARQTQKIDIRPKIDLSAVYEVTFFKTQLSEGLKRWQQGQQAEAMVEVMAGLIQKGSLPPYQTELKDHMVDVVTSSLNPDEVKKLSSSFLSIARQSRSSELSCFSGYIRGQNCLVRESQPTPIDPPGRKVQPPVKGSDETKKGPKNGSETGVPRSAPEEEAHSESEPTPDAPSSSAAAVEVARINQLPNKAVLFSYNESTGQLSRETATLGGLTFTAKSLGAVGSGRFQLQVSPSQTSPVKLSKGRYRTKVALLLDYVREDRCTAGALRCLVNQTVTHSKLLNKVVYFDVGPYNAYTSSSAASFGSLMPLSTGGSGLYESALKSTRLSIKNVELELTYRVD